ncbi:uncharacterized protein LOC108143802 [Drosophila elegans]|uniref:uncharacterized protein LOC108143802 n=1 Tax=Drosophila elegans TaxID=30023 RepID=UPI0007E665EA|nr:uncharacterized protein LOC108143802 [Drosophila elegans]
MSRKIKLDLELVLETLLNAVRRKKKSRPEVPVEDTIERTYGDRTEGIFVRMYEFIVELALPILEQLFDFVEYAILQVIGFVENAVEVFLGEIKAQQAALEALVEYLTKYLGFAITC